MSKANAAAPPFPNVYQLRRVAETNCKPCMTCYKPASTCLVSLNYSTLPPSLSENVIDFFYVCEAHLSDVNFCKVRYIDASVKSPGAIGSLSVGATKDKAFAELHGKQVDAFKKISHLESLIAKQSSQFTKISNYLWSSKKEKDKGDEKDKDKEESTDKDGKEIDKNVDKLNLVQLESKLKEAKGQLGKIDDEIKTFKKSYLKYELDPVIYMNRLKIYHKKIAEMKYKEKINSPGFFPDLSNLPELPKKNDGSGSNTPK